MCLAVCLSVCLSMCLSVYVYTCSQLYVSQGRSRCAKSCSPLSSKMLDVKMPKTLCVSVSVHLQGIMLVYDITTVKSFDNISEWIRDVDEVTCPSVCLFIVHLSVCKSVSLSVHLSESPFVCLSVCPFV